MAEIPRNPEDVSALLRMVKSGIDANPTLWANPPATGPQLEAQADVIDAASADQQIKQALAKQSTATKTGNVKDGRTILTRMKAWAISIVGRNDPRIEELGFTEDAPPTPLAPPGQVRNLIARDEQPTGQLTLVFDKPVGGGAPAVLKIQRKLPTDADFVLIDAIPSNEIKRLLVGQPVNVLMQFRMIASNNAGDSVPSNTIQVRL